MSHPLFHGSLPTPPVLAGPPLAEPTGWGGQGCRGAQLPPRTPRMGSFAHSCGRRACRCLRPGQGPGCALSPAGRQHSTGDAPDGGYTGPALSGWGRWAMGSDSRRGSAPTAPPTAVQTAARLQDPPQSSAGRQKTISPERSRLRPRPSLLHEGPMAGPAPQDCKGACSCRCPERLGRGACGVLGVAVAGPGAGGPFQEGLWATPDHMKAGGSLEGAARCGDRNRTRNRPHLFSGPQVPESPTGHALVGKHQVCSGMSPLHLGPWRPRQFPGLGSAGRGTPGFFRR